MSSEVSDMEIVTGEWQKIHKPLINILHNGETYKNGLHWLFDCKKYSVAVSSMCHLFQSNYYLNLGVVRIRIKPDKAKVLPD